MSKIFYKDKGTAESPYPYSRGITSVAYVEVASSDLGRRLGEIVLWFTNADEMQ